MKQIEPPPKNQPTKKKYTFSISMKSNDAEEWVVQREVEVVVGLIFP